MEEIKEGVKTGNQFWVRFDSLSGKLLNANDEGRGNESGNMTEQRMIVTAGPQPSQGRATNVHSHLNTLINNNCHLGLNNNHSQLLLQGGPSAERREAAPKKRPRNNEELLAIEGGTSRKTPSNDEMFVEEGPVINKGCSEQTSEAIQVRTIMDSRTKLQTVCT
ncbi:hypothetical protein TSUD_137500 [Trifolium subterraneum]|uniref:Uncharacterized protein n=1 Tax=Trifolium subterraneum TaxID=3900 RepID=A0A2Z6P3F1_TRISU|nr:hypothetical protein TSUD_137500 [Trifolium subterraneum]